MDRFELRTEFLHFSENRSKVRHQDLVKHYIIFQSYLLTRKMSCYCCWCLCWGMIQRSDNNVVGCNQDYRTHPIISLTTLKLCVIIWKYNIQNIWYFLAVQSICNVFMPGPWSWPLNQIMFIPTASWTLCDYSHNVLRNQSLRLLYRCAKSPYEPVQERCCTVLDVQSTILKAL